MNLLPLLEKNIWTVKRTVLTFLMRTAVSPKILFASKNRLLLSTLYAGVSRKKTVVGCFTTGKEVLDYLRHDSLGILICTIDLADGDGTGDLVVQQARQIQPALRCILVIDHFHWNATQSSLWQSPVILAAEDVGDGSEPMRMAMLAAIANTTYRSKSIPPGNTDLLDQSIIKLTNRERQMLECYALGLTNAEAAERLNLSPQSTKTYSRNLLSKLEVSNRQLALIKALGRGLIKAV